MERHIIFLYIVVTFTLITSIFFYINRDADTVSVYKNKLTTTSIEQLKVQEFTVNRDSSAVLQLNIFGYKNNFEESIHIIQSRSHHNNNGSTTTSPAYSEELGDTPGFTAPIIDVKSSGNLVEILLTPGDDTETIWHIVASITK